MRKLFMAVLMFFGIAATAAAQSFTQDEMKRDLEAGVVSFVRSVKGQFPGGAGNFDEFRLKLIGSSNVASITPEGNELLKVTYEFIQQGASDDQIKEAGIRSFARALNVVLHHESKGYSGADLERGSAALFGGDASGLLGYQPTARTGVRDCPDYRECRWFQLGCHAHNVSTWICKQIQAYEAILEIIEGPYLLPYL
ncbi:hypothetical protein [Flaviaesturariibacter amylovorans]|uniref:Uncharacterized protein n=1 Tax=Flaviaesturariibacter amylovorans TaxID=1084520 RepID=A0ABP8G645_9BACT